MRERDLGSREEDEPSEQHDVPCCEQDGDGAGSAEQGRNIGHRAQR